MLLNISPNRPRVWDSGEGFQTGLVPTDCVHTTEPDEQLLAEADAIVFQDFVLSPEQLRFAARCQLIVHAGSGAGGLDAELARDLGILVSSVPEGATPEYAALVERELREFIASRGEKPGRRAPRLGIVGLGNVGCAVAAHGRALGFEIWASDPFAHPEIFRRERIQRASLCDLMGICDVVTLHCPAGAEAEPLLGDAELSLMKKGSWLINTSASELIDARALVEIVRGGRIGAAKLLTAEALRLLQRPEVKLRTWRRAMEIAVAGLRGSPPEHLLIDPPLARAEGGSL